MKKFICLILSISACLGTIAHADDSWRDMYVTRLMKLMTSNPSYTNIALTDLDNNGVPEAFMVKFGMNGGIKTGITLSNNVITTIEVPENITGAVLTDITVYNVDGEYCFIGKEISRYTSKIDYYELSLSNNTLSAVKVLKNDYSKYPALPYEDIFENDLFVDNFPDRKKLDAFIARYNSPVHITVKPATAKLSVNGNNIDVSGICVNDTNYYKLRDIATVMISTTSKFNVMWDANRGAIMIVPGKVYTTTGDELGEMSDLSSAKVEAQNVTIITSGVSKTLSAYNIDGSNYFKIRDIASIAGFNVGWDDSSKTVAITEQ